MTVLIVISNIIMSGATVVLAIFAISNFCLAKSIKEKNEQYEQVMRDLLQALVIATMCAPHGGESKASAMQYFIANYKGKTRIFE
jgi:hypothetical protein